MRIIFLCSSLECGRDGVGDYTRLLAQKLLTFGHEIKVIALNDRHIAAQSIEKHDQSLSIIRFGSQVCWKRRTDIAREQLEKFCPDWVSLQYVPYGYSSKGAPIFLPDQLASIRGDFKWHLMFHELWVEPIGLYRKFISTMQRQIVSSLCRKLAPSLVHTTNTSYSDKLAQAGISASILPLFSNIELAQSNPQLRSQLIQNCGFRANDDEIWVFVFFGSIHPGWNVDVFLERISHAARKAGKKAVILLSIGKNPCQEHASLSSLRKIKAGFLHFREIGEMATADISHYLQAADFCVATTPLGLLGKSGSAAAMASHGIPIVVPRIDVRLDRDSLDKKGILPVDEFFEEKLLNPPRPHKFDSVAEIAQLFLKTLDPNFEVR